MSVGTETMWSIIWQHGCGTTESGDDLFHKPGYPNAFACGMYNGLGYLARDIRTPTHDRPL